MSEMVERIAEVLKGFDLDGASMRYEDELLKAAKAAIEAMREPTAAIEQMSMCNDFARNLWPAMIDEALK